MQPGSDLDQSIGVSEETVDVTIASDDHLEKSQGGSTMVTGEEVTRTSNGLQVSKKF